jgi:hypothetical protein
MKLRSLSLLCACALSAVVLTACPKQSPAPDAPAAPADSSDVRRLQKDFDALKSIGWTTSEEENVNILKNVMPNKLMAFKEEAIEVIRKQEDYDSVAAARYFIGMSRFVFADMLGRLPPPVGLSDAEADVYRSVVDAQYRLPVEQAGRAMLQATIDQARSDHRWSIWDARALTVLEERGAATN